MVLTRALGKTKSLLRLRCGSRSYTSLTLLCTLWYLISCRTECRPSGGDPPARGARPPAPDPILLSCGMISSGAPLPFLVTVTVPSSTSTLRAARCDLPTFTCGTRRGSRGGPHPGAMLVSGPPRALTSKHCTARGLVAGGGATRLGSARLCRDTVSCRDLSTWQREERELGTGWGRLRCPQFGGMVGLGAQSRGL